VEAIPVFEEVFVPFFTYVAARRQKNASQWSEIISVGLDPLARDGDFHEVTVRTRFSFPGSQAHGTSRKNSSRSECEYPERTPRAYSTRCCTFDDIFRMLALPSD
jgi:hypothetical protein